MLSIIHLERIGLAFNVRTVHLSALQSVKESSDGVGDLVLGAMSSIWQIFPR